MEFLQARDYFLSQLETAENKSLPSIKAYDSDIRLYFEYLQKNDIALSEVTSKTVEDFLLFFCASHCSNSANRMLSALRTFYRIICGIEPAINNPTNLIRGMKTPNKLPVYVSCGDLQKLFNSFDDSDKGILDSCILITLYSCGLRISELCTLKLNDVHLKQRQIKVFGKGSKERIVPLNDVCIEKMQEYLNFSRSQSRDPHFFLNMKGNPLNRQYVDRLIKKKCVQLNLSPEISAHSFRHSFATSLLAGNADLRIVQELLGHSDIRTTQIYTHVETERLKQVYDQAMPDPFQKGRK
ncbi:tyrosine-type recombinase/integrase [Ileibacterium valens]|uniref:tyrosine-type recombinase/integrase n=1 Tax=Ileibacterium valens TaxID=1862668 RepID=UPI00272D317D|nr:tyrosine-type recombinase/integrase [Ileibacterium valens]